MAAAPEPTGPAYTIAALARLPIRDGMKASDIHHVCMSQAHTLETLASVIDTQAHALRQVMARSQGGGITAPVARMAAYRATRPMRQAAARARAAAASSRASWKATERAFAFLINPSPGKGKQRGPNWRS